jgi:chromate transporter
MSNKGKVKNMNILLDLFVTFLKIGTFTVGGGPSMIPLIEKKAVHEKKWISKEDFVDMLALAQTAPGPIAIDASAYVGYRVAGIPGSICAVLGSIFTGYLAIIVIVIYFTNMNDNKIVQGVFMGIRPAVVALLAVPALTIGKSTKINRKTIIIPIITIVLVVVFNITPIYLIIVSAIMGILYGAFVKRRVNK